MILANVELEFNAKGVAFREVAGIGVAMRRGDLFEVEGSSLDLFREIVRKRTNCSSLATILTRRYGIPLSQALQDVEQFVSQLYSRRLLLKPVMSYPDRDLHSGDANAVDNFRCWALAREEHIPLKCKLNVTYRCNVACKFCYNGDRPGLPGSYPREAELQIMEIERILLELYDAGTFILSLTGGEPFVRKDLIDILEITDNLCFAVEILTNGTLITEHLAEKLSRHRLQIVVVPLFGATAVTHDAFVRIPGAFKKACAGIQALLSAGIEVGVRCSITRANFSEWRALRSLVESWGARYFPHVQVHLSSDRKVDLRAIRLNDQSISELFEAGLELNPDYRCEVGLARVDVFPNGDVALCSLLAEPLGNLRIQSFTSIWHSSLLLKEMRSRIQGGVTCCKWCGTRSDVAYRCGADALFDDGALNQPSSEALRIVRLARIHRSQGKGSN